MENTLSKKSHEKTEDKINSENPQEDQATLKIYRKRRIQFREKKRGEMWENGTERCFYWHRYMINGLIGGNVFNQGDKSGKYRK